MLHCIDFLKERNLLDTCGCHHVLEIEHVLPCVSQNVLFSCVFHLCCCCSCCGFAQWTKLFRAPPGRHQTKPAASPAGTVMPEVAGARFSRHVFQRYVTWACAPKGQPVCERGSPNIRRVWQHPKPPPPLLLIWSEIKREKILPVDTPTWLADNDRKQLYWEATVVF